MKIALISDTHNEFGGSSYIDLLPEDGTVDVLVAAGDIDHGWYGLRDLMDKYLTTHVIYVPGNHEYYGTSISKLNEELIEVSENKDNIHVFIDGGTVTIDDVKFVGGVGWSAPEDDHVKRMINDYRMINDSHEITKDLRKYFIDYLRLMSDNTNRKLIGIMHFLPTMDCVSERWRKPVHDLLNREYFVTHIPEDLMAKFDYFLFGHTHDQVNCRINSTELISNPRGYPTERDYQWRPLIFDV